LLFVSYLTIQYLATHHWTTPNTTIPQLNMIYEYDLTLVSIVHYTSSLQTSPNATAHHQVARYDL